MLSLHKLDRQTWVKFFTHLIVIIIIFFLPDMMMNYGRMHRHPLMERMMYFKAAAFVAVFYINYYLIINRTLFAKKSNYFAFILWNLLLIVAFIASFYTLRTLIWGVPPAPKGNPNFEMPRKVMLLREWSYILRDVGIIILTIALSAALRFAERWAAIEKRHEKLLATQRDDELQNLKSQLNPHFLFNTLNTIYSLIEIDPKEAQQAVHQLSKLLRHMLYENPLRVSLGQEVDFAKSYISLMEMRLGEGAVKADFDHIADENLMIAPLLFVSLIENAFKHGNTGHPGEPIEISITSDSEGVVTCRTFNHFVHHAKVDAHESVTKERKGGIGLSNLRRRLLLIYGHDASLSTKVEGDTYTAILTVNTKNDR